MSTISCIDKTKIRRYNTSDFCGDFVFSDKVYVTDKEDKQWADISERMDSAAKPALF